MKNELTQFCLHIKFTINQNLSNNVQKSYPTQNSTNDQHCPNFTIPNNSTIQKCPKIKNQLDHAMISIQIIQYPKTPTRANNKKMTMPHHKVLNKTQNQQIYQDKTKKWAQLEIFFGWVWIMVAWVLKESLFIIPF